MNKDTIELERLTDHIYKYGRLDEPRWSESQLLDRVVEWSHPEHYSPLENYPKRNVYRHVLRREQENISEDRFYMPFVNKVDGPGDRNLKIPYCDLVYYLDIYYQ